MFVSEKVDTRIVDRLAAVEALPPLRDVIGEHGLSAQKSLGQNFLLDINITDKIVRAAQGYAPKVNWSDVHAFEIGPGPGGLTRSLLKSSAKKVTALEFDSRAIAALSSLVQASGGDLDLVQQDALTAHITQMCDAPRVIIANLPYNIATPLLIGWLKDIRANHASYASMTLMFQKEVAERIVAAPASKAYGRLAVISQWLCHVKKVFDLPPSAFTPPPKVVSSVVQFVPNELAGDAPDFKAVETVTAAAFNQRRKMIRSSMKDYMSAIEALGIDSQKRAEELTVQDFLNIAAF